MCDSDAIPQAGKGTQASKSAQAGKGSKRSRKDASDEVVDTDSGGPQAEEIAESADLEVTPKPRKRAKTKAEKAEEKANGLRNAIQASRGARSSAPVEAHDTPDASKSAVRDRDTSQAQSHGSASAAATTSQSSST